MARPADKLREDEPAQRLGAACTISPASVAGAVLPPWGAGKLIRGCPSPRNRGFSRPPDRNRAAGDGLGIVDDGGSLAETVFTPCDQQGHLVDVADALDILAAEDQRFLSVSENLPGNDAVGDVSRHVVGQPMVMTQV